MKRIIVREILLIQASMLAIFGMSDVYAHHAEHPLASLAVVAVGLTLYAVSRSYAFLGDAEKDKEGQASLAFRSVAYFQSIILWSLAAKILFMGVEWYTVSIAVVLLGIAVSYVVMSHKTPIPRWMRGPKTWAEIQEEKQAKLHS